MYAGGRRWIHRWMLVETPLGVDESRRTLVDYGGSLGAWTLVNAPVDIDGYTGGRRWRSLFLLSV